MRANINLKLEQPLKLPIHYNHILQAVILRWLGDENYSKFIHDTGYSCGNRKYKLYCFSRFNGKFQINKLEKTIKYYDKVSFVVSSVEDEFLSYLVNNIIKNDELIIGNNNVVVEDIECSSKKLKGLNEIYTKSPIVVYSTLMSQSGKKTYYYNPFENEFKMLIQENLIKKYIAINNRQPIDTTFNIYPVEGSKPKEIIDIYKGTVIKGWSGKFKIEGADELLNIGYNAGLGSKNSMGFGCIEIM